MSLVLKIVAVAGLATFSGALAVPLGVFIGLHPLVVYGVSAATAIAVTWTLLLGGHRLRSTLAARLGHSDQTVTRTGKLVDRYGPFGLGLIGPLFPGVLTSTISGVAVGIESKRLGLWLSIGIGLWFAVFTVLWWAVSEGLIR